jgi:GNAT superfamily N-acetyltransferase
MDLGIHEELGRKCEKQLRSSHSVFTKCQLGALRAMLIRAAASGDASVIWSILEPTIRAGETYPLPTDLSEAGALSYWMAPGNRCFVALDEGNAAGTYYLRPNQAGGGGHVANCGYMTAFGARGKGVGRRMCEHSLAEARGLGFRAIQFNFVVSSNAPAVHLWMSMGFDVAGRLPLAFRHPFLGYVDALVMFKTL